MTSARDTRRALIAERFGEDVVPLELEGPTDGEAGRRARFIATLHALIAWLTAHPTVPVPWSSGFNVHVSDRTELLQLASTLEGAGVDVSQGNADDCFVVFRPVEQTEFYCPISVHVKERSDA